jgi:hypothetical protein
LKDVADEGPHLVTTDLPESADRPTCGFSLGRFRFSEVAALGFVSWPHGGRPTVLSLPRERRIAHGQYFQTHGKGSGPE